MKNPFTRKPKQPTIDPAELARLRLIERMTSKLVELLDKGEVDYDLVEQIKVALNG